jgi:hypothetical protein
MTSTFARVDYKFDPANWNYIGEGKMHIVCGYCEIGDKNEISIRNSTFSCANSDGVHSRDTYYSNCNTYRGDSSTNDNNQPSAYMNHQPSGLINVDPAFNDEGISIIDYDRINCIKIDYRDNNESNSNNDSNSYIKSAMYNNYISQSEIEKSTDAVISTTPLISNIVTKDKPLDANDATTTCIDTNTMIDFNPEIFTTNGTRDHIVPMSIIAKNLVLRLTKGYYHGDKVIHDELYVHRIMEPWFMSYCFQRTIVRLPSDFLRGILC